MDRLKPDIHAIFDDAIQLASDVERARFLDQACGDDPQVRRRIDSLLRAHTEAGGFLNLTSVSSSATVIHPVNERPGTTIGRYTLHNQIGEGGFGVVYRAQQTKPVKREVALKIIKPGMDTKEVINRFAAEQQALALMNHPHIARVIDAGATDTGRPYFVMDLVEGIPITDYCDQQKLSTDDRLRLFLQVGDAVQHAHQKGIIHRDLKPSNVMVTLHDGKPVSKVIDFGVAKAISQRLTEQTIYTSALQMIGTPLYMSPEQAEPGAIDVDTRSDVYSLGVLLYELLTGTTPFDRERFKSATYDEIRRVIREEDPPRPSARLSTLGAGLSTAAERRQSDPRRLTAGLQNELDWIVMKALEKDRERRYESVTALAADVARYLGGEPVRACPPSAWYRVKKHTRKNRGMLITATVLVLTLLAGTGVSVWQAIRANTNEANALAEATAARDARKAESLQRQRAEAAENRAKHQLTEVEQQRSIAFANLYSSDVRLGFVDANAGNAARLSDRLIRHIPQRSNEDLRGWEWYYLLSLCHPEEMTLMQHRSPVSSVAWSPDDRHLASTGPGATHIYDAASGKLVWSYDSLHSLGASWSPTGKQFAWGETSSDNGVYLIDIETKEIKRLAGHASSVWTTAWSPDGKYVASAGMDPVIRIWDATTGECVHIIEGIESYVTSLAWHPTSPLLAAGMAYWNRGPVVWSTETWKPVYSALQDGVSVAWTPDGNVLFTGTVDGKILAHRATDWSTASTWQSVSSGSVNCIAINAEGSELAAAGADNKIQIFDLDTGECLRTFIGHRNQVKWIVWSPDGRKLVSGGMDGLVKIWERSKEERIQHLSGHPGGTLDIHWDNDSKTLRSFGTTDGAMAVWNTETGELANRLPVSIGSAAQFSSEPKRIVLFESLDGSTRARIHDADTGVLRHEFSRELRSDFVAAISPDASRLALTNGTELLAIDTVNNDVSFRHQIGLIGKLAWSNDGKLLAAAGYGEPDDGGYRQWAAWIYVFDPGEGKRLLKLQHGTSRVTASTVAWAPDGQRLASADVNGLVIIWDVVSGRRIAGAQLHTSLVTDLNFSPDGRRIASASRDGTIRVSETKNLAELLNLIPTQGQATQVKWSPDGRRLAAAFSDGSMKIWDASYGYVYSESQEFYFEQIHDQLTDAAHHYEAGRTEAARTAFQRIIETKAGRTESFPPWVSMDIRRSASGNTSSAPNADNEELSEWLTRLGVTDPMIDSDNNTAWGIARFGNPNASELLRAKELVEIAVQKRPFDGAIWHTLGVCCYRVGDWSGARNALDRSSKLRLGGDSFDWFFLAMTHWQLGNHDEAREFYRRAVTWMDANNPQEEELVRFRAEAAQLLSIDDARAEPPLPETPTKGPD